jgi:WD40 repeat protein
MNESAVVTEFFPGDSGRLAALYSDGSVRVYTEDRAQAPTVLGPSARPVVSGNLGMAISSERLALSGPTGIRLHRLDGTQDLLLTVNSGCSGNQLRFSAEGGELIAWGSSALCVWRTADGALLQTLPGEFHSAGIAAGRLVTTEPGSLRVKSRALGEATFLERELAPVGSELETPVSVTVSPRLDSFAAFSRSEEHFWGNLWSATGDLQRSISVDPNQALNSTLSYSPSGRWLLLGDQLIDIDSDEIRTTALASTYRYRPLWRVDDSGQRLGGLFTVNVELAAVELSRIFMPANRRIFGSLPKRDEAARGASNSLAISPDGTRLVTSGSSDGAGQSLLWDVSANFEQTTILGHLPVELPLEVDFSPDGKKVAVTGDGWGLFSAEAEGPPLVSTPPPPSVSLDDCWFNFARFSSHGNWLVRGSYGGAFNVFDADLASTRASLPTSRCNGRASFNSTDTLLATSGPELYRTSDWSRVWPQDVIPRPSDTLGSSFFDDVRFTPDDKSLLLTSCTRYDEQCTHALYDLNGTLIRKLPELTGVRAVFSREGHWIVSGNALLHVPTNELRSFEQKARLSTFAPNGDIVSVLSDNTLARYCRAPSSP